MNGGTIRHRNWMITSFNVGLYDTWKDIQCGDWIRYFIYQMEEGKETKKQHLQGYIELNKPTSIKRLKKLLNDNTLHCEVRMGTQMEAINYCSKEDTRIMDTVIIGTKANQGFRTDLESLYNDIRNGMTWNDIVMNYPNQIVRYSRGVERLFNDLRADAIPNFQKVNTSILWGDAGTGKTKFVYDNHDFKDVYRLRLTNNSIWFDGYTGQKVLLIDDFYGQIKFHDMLEYLDGYKFQVPVKGGMVWKNWNTVYITSNKHPKKWYKDFNCMDKKEWCRRITEIIEFVDLNKGINEPECTIINKKCNVSIRDGNMIQKLTAYSITDTLMGHATTKTEKNEQRIDDYCNYTCSSCGNDYIECSCN